MPATSPEAKTKAAAYRSAWAKTPEGRKKMVDYQRNLRAKKMAVIRSYKEAKGCRDCGETDPIVLELHHRNPDDKHHSLKPRGKEQRTGGGFWNRLGFAAIADELEKCEVMCANCHRRETYRSRTHKWLERATPTG